MCGNTGDFRTGLRGVLCYEEYVIEDFFASHSPRSLRAKLPMLTPYILVSLRCMSLFSAAWKKVVPRVLARDEHSAQVFADTVPFRA